MTNNNTKLYVSAIVLLTILSCYLLIAKERRPSAPIIETCREAGNPTTKQGQANFSDSRTLFFENYTNLIMPNEGVKLNTSIALIDTTFINRPLKNFLKKENTLIFKYSYADCELCIDKVLELLNDMNFDSKRLLIVTDSYSEKDFLVKTRYLKTKFTVHSLTEGNMKMGLPLEGKNLPFLFLLNRNGIVSNVYTPFKKFPKQIENYLNFIAQKLKD